MKTNILQNVTLTLKKFCVTRLYSVIFLLTMGVAQLWGAEATWTFQNGSDELTDKSPISVTYGDGNASTSTQVSGEKSETRYLRLYPKRDGVNAGNGGWVTFTAGSGYQITAIQVNFNDNRTVAYGKIDNGDWAAVFGGGVSTSITISDLTATSYSIKNGQASGDSNKNITIKSIVVTYSSSGCNPITPSLIYSADSIGIGGTATVSSLSGNTGEGTVTYSSSNTSVATVNSSTGEVSAVATGSATITATIDENGGYCDGSATADIIVRRGLNYYIGNSSYTIGGKDDDLLVSLLPHSPSSCEEDNYPYFYGWKSGTITGSTTTPPTILDDETLSSSSAANTYYAVFRDWFCWNGGTASTLTAYDEVSASGLGSDYAANNMPYMVKLDHTGDYIIISTKSQPSSITLKVKMIGGATSSYITVQESTAADGDFTDVEELNISGSQNDVVTLVTSKSFASTTRAIKLVFTKGSNVGLGYIRIDGVSSALYVTSCAAVYDITLDKNGGEADGSAEVVANRTSLRNISVPTQAGYHIEGYYTDAAFTTKVATAAGELQPSITVGGNAWTDEDGEWVRGADETFYTKWLTYSDYKFSCAELTLEAKLVTASTPIFITSAAGKTVRSQDSILITGSGLTPNQALEFPNLDSKFAVKSRTNTALTVGADGTINAVAYIFYTPGADETTDGILKATGLTVKVGGGKPRQATLTQDIIGRHIATDFVIAGKKDGKWYAMPDTMTTTSHPTPIEIAVDDYDNPSIAYTASTNMYNLYGQNSGAGYLEEAGQYVKLGMKNNPNFANYPLLGTSSTSLGKSTGTDPTNNLDKQYWWLFTQTNKNITNPQDAKYIVHCANNASSLSIKNSPSQWGLYASGVDEIRLIPASSVENTESEVVAWGQKKLILEIEKPLLATQARAKISGGSWSANKSLATTTGTSVKGSATKYNYTLDFTSDDFDFANAANEGKMLIVELLNSEGTALKASSVIIPRIVAADRTINKTTDDKKTPWNTEVHVLPGVTLTLDASGYSTPKNMTIKELNVYPGATINVEKDTLKATTLILRNGWNRLGASTEYDVARIYITKDAGSLQATNVYADWYIDFDQYYPIAVPWNVTVENIKYKNTKAAATFGESSSIRLRYYDGASRAANVQSGVGESANWKIFGAGTNDAVPETLEPGKGYAMCAKRPTGKAFSIVRMPLTLPSGTWDAGSWTKNGESGSVSTDHKDQVSVTAHGDEKTPTYAKGWNFIANPYMAIYQGAISHSVGEEYNVEFVNIPDTEFKEYEQKSVELAKLKPASAFLIQATATGTLTFGTTHRQASAPSYRNDTRPAVSRQKAHIVLSGEGAEDVMGIFVSEKYTAEYELNADLQKLLSDGNTLRTYMRYGDMNMAYVAINEELAREWIPVMVRMPENGEYTFSLHLASTVSELEGLYLTDYQTGITTNLLFDDYSFTAAAGTLSNRFAINAIVGDHRVPTGADVTGLDKDSKEPIKFIWHDNVYILHNNVIYDSTGKRVNVINK